MEVFNVSRDLNSTSIIANFSNGELINSGKTEKLKFSVSENKGRGLRCLDAESCRLTYSGANDSAIASSASDLSRYMVGVFNRRTRKLKLVDTSMFNLQPNVQSEDENLEIQEMTSGEKLDMLTSAFGTQKKRRAMESRQRNTLTEEVLEYAVVSSVDQILTSPDSRQFDVSRDQQETSDLLPPFDCAGVTHEEVYKFDSILLPHQLGALEGVADVFSESTSADRVQWTKELTYPEFVLKHVSALPKEEAARRRRCTQLMYLTYLIKLYHAKSYDVRKMGVKGAVDPAMPEVIKQRLIRDFTQEDGTNSIKQRRALTARMKDKLLAYLLVVCLHIESFHLDPTLLQKDLKISQKKLHTLFRAIGCKVSQSRSNFGPGPKATETTVTLPLPLTFPEVRGRKRGPRD